MKKMLFTMLAIIAAVAFTACGETKKELTKQEKYLIIGKAHEAVAEYIFNLFTRWHNATTKEQDKAIEDTIKNALPKEIFDGYKKQTGKDFTLLTNDNTYEMKKQYFEKLSAYGARGKDFEELEKAFNKFLEEKSPKKKEKILINEFTVYKAKQDGVDEAFTRNALNDPIQLEEIKIEFEHYVRGNK